MLEHAFTQRSRETMQTLPHDLSEYARVETGPESWSARCDTAALSAWAKDAGDQEPWSRATNLLVSISPADVPRVAMSAEGLVSRVTLREAFVIASIDGESTLESLLGTLDMPTGEVLSIVCELCASGILTLEAAPH